MSGGSRSTRARVPLVHTDQTISDMHAISTVAKNP